MLNIDYEELVKDENSNTEVTITKNKSITVYVGKYVDEESKVSYYVMLPDSELLCSLSETVGEELFKALEADFSSTLVAPVLESDAVQFKIEYGANNHTGKVPYSDHV